MKIFVIFLCLVGTCATLTCKQCTTSNESGDGFEPLYPCGSTAERSVECDQGCLEVQATSALFDRNNPVKFSSFSSPCDVARFPGITIESILCKGLLSQRAKSGFSLDVTEAECAALITITKKIITYD